MPPASAHTPHDARLDTVTIGRAIWVGATPLILLVVVIALATLGDLVARTLAFPLGFLTWNSIVEGIWVGGLLLAVVVGVIATVRALRLASLWRRAGMAQQAMSAYWSLLIVALLVLAPVILAIALPQHPAPPRAP